MSITACDTAIYIDQTRYDAFAGPNHHIDSLMFVAQDKNYDKVMALKRNIDAVTGPSGLNVLYRAVVCRTPAHARTLRRVVSPGNIIINIKQLARRHAEQVAHTPDFCCSA
jgi:hypothetical protein